MQLGSSKKHTILVSGASGIVGYGILRSLHERGDCFLIGTTIYKQSPANCFSDVVELVPATDHPDYMNYLVSLIDKYSVDMIIPAIEADMSVWNQHYNVLESTGTYVLNNNPGLVNLCLDKWEFYKQLEKSGYKGRINSSLDHDFARFKCPFILKPRCGFGACGLVKIESKEQFMKYEGEIGDKLMMQEYVGNDEEEYTISAFFDSYSEIRAVIGMKRKLAKLGYTQMAEVVEVDEFLDDIRQLAILFKPIGPTNFQFRKHMGQLKLLEINPRISSSTSMRCKFGYNESSMAIDYFLDNKIIIQPQMKRGKAMRYIEDYIL